jgi:hypothetical protein
MQHRNAVALLKSLETMLTACLDENRRQGVDFDCKSWTQIRDLAESPAFVAAFAKLDEREEDRALAKELGALIANVTSRVAREAEISPDEFENRLREAYPLFAETADGPDLIRNAASSRSIWPKPPECRVDRSVQTRLHIVEMLENLLAAGRVVLISRTAHTYDASISGPSKNSTASTLEDSIEGLTDHPRTKVCLRVDCESKGRPRPIWAFPSTKEGHGSVCNQCESTRRERIRERDSSPQERV